MTHLEKRVSAKLSPHDLRAISVESCVDPRTIRAFIDGRVTRSTTAARIRKALNDAGRADLIPSLGTPGEK